ncbi:hypothetical protein [Fusobacterium polymorphum]|uniref:hypothetical protein n=1 Tax=Fusobacterium nucleatum subsp. polymorphum TaxID=76857 RepID=UPI0030CAB9B2
MIKLKKESNEKYIKLLNKSNNFYLTNEEMITNIYYGEKEIYRLAPGRDDESPNSTTDIPNEYNLYDSIYPVDVERYIFKTGKLDLIDVDSPKFDITTALWIYLCWYQLFGYDAKFKEEFITKEDKLNNIVEEKKEFFNSCFEEKSVGFIKQYAPYNLNKKIVIYKKNCNTKIDKILEPLIKKIEKSKIIFNYMNGKEFEEVFYNKISNYEFLKKNIFIPKKYEYTDEKLHKYDFKIWVKSIKITGGIQNSNIEIILGNTGIGFKESGFKICLFNNDYANVELSSIEKNFNIMNLTPNNIVNEQDIIVQTSIYLPEYTNLFIGIVKMNENSISEFLKLNNKNYENENIVHLH